LTRFGWIYLIALSVLFGVVAGFLDIFLKVFLLVIIASCYLVFVIVWIIDLFTKTSRWKYVFPFLFVATLTFIISIITYKINDSIKKNSANKIIQKIYEYQKRYDRFPDSLSQINQQTNKFGYMTEHKLTEFELSYSIDGWNINSFSSRDSAWHYHD